jgi:hypothetical protein
VKEYEEKADMIDTLLGIKPGRARLDKFEETVPVVSSLFNEANDDTLTLMDTLATSRAGQTGPGWGNVVRGKAEGEGSGGRATWWGRGGRW